MNIKEILNTVLSTSGFLERPGFFASSDPDDKQMTAIANQIATEIRDFYPWPALQREFTLTFAPGVLRYQLPVDFWHLVPDTVWETDGAKQAEWPTPKNRWYSYRFSGFSDGGTIRIRRVGEREIELSDPPSAASITFAYLSRYLVRDANGSLKQSFTLDTDTFDLWDRMLVAGIQARWAEVKGMPQAPRWEARFYERLNQGISQANDGKVIGRGTKEGRGAPYYPLWRPS